MTWPPYESRVGRRPGHWCDGFSIGAPPAAWDWIGPSGAIRTARTSARLPVQHLGASLCHRPHAWALLDALIDFGADQTFGDPLLISPVNVEVILMSWAPEALSAPRSTLALLPDLLVRVRGIRP